MELLSQNRSGKKALQYLVLTLGATLLFQPAQASTTYTFDFTDFATNYGTAIGNSRIFTSGAVTITATAWSGSWVSNNLTFTQARLESWDGYGLGVCNAAELAISSPDCDIPDHQVDNNLGYDFVLFRFNRPVSVRSFTINPYGSFDRDVTYYVGSIAANLTGLSVNSLGLTAINTDSVASDASRMITANTSYVTALLVAARLPITGSGADANFDYWKVDTLILEAPESSTFAMLGSALVLLGVVRRRKQSTRAVLS